MFEIVQDLDLHFLKVAKETDKNYYILYILDK